MIPSAQEIADEIRMRCTYYSGPFLLVEGSSDVTFFKCRMNINIEDIIPTFGWQNLTNAMSLLQADGFQKILGVVDLDYRGIIDYPNLPANIVITDDHDIETMMLNSRAFTKVIKSKSSSGKIKSYPNGIEGVQNKILQLGIPIGSLRFYSDLKGKNYSFNEMNFDKFIDRKSLLFLSDKFVGHMQGIHQNNISISTSILSIAIGEANNIPLFGDSFRLCSGHDLMEILAIGLKSVWGTYDSQEMSKKSLEDAFSLAYSHDFFAQTTLFREMESWFCHNKYTLMWSE
jgi:hypothetical protein